MERDQQTIGIDAITYSIPKAYVALPDLAAARGIPAAKYTSGLGTLEMAVASPEEDPVTLAVNAARRHFLDREGGVPADLTRTVLQSPTRFAEYAAASMFGTLPPVVAPAGAIAK